MKVQMTTMKLLLSLSLAMLSNAALPPDAQEKAEITRINDSPHFGKLRAEALMALQILVGPYKQKPGLIPIRPPFMPFMPTVYRYTSVPLLFPPVFPPVPILPPIIPPVNYSGTITIVPYPSQKPGFAGPLVFGLRFSDGTFEPAPGHNGPPTPVLPLPLGPGPVIIDPPHEAAPKDDMGRPARKVDPKADNFTLKSGEMGYFTDACGTAYLGAKPGLEQVGTFSSDDQGIVSCTTVDVTPRMLAGGLRYQQRFQAGDNAVGTTTVANAVTGKRYTVTVTAN